MIEAMQGVLDWLFRMRLYWGVRVNVARDFIEIDPIYDGKHGVSLSISKKDQLTRWLLCECEGPWRIKADRNKHMIIAYLSFARIDDAVMFRLLMT